MNKEESVYEEQKELVLARLRTLNPEAKMMSGRDRTISVKELISHVEKSDQLGVDIVKAQIKMLQVLTSG